MWWGAIKRDNALLLSWGVPMAIHAFTTKPMLLQLLSASAYWCEAYYVGLVRQIRAGSSALHTSAPARTKNGFSFLEGLWFSQQCAVAHKFTAQLTSSKSSSLCPRLPQEGSSRLHTPQWRRINTEHKLLPPGTPLLSGNSVHLCFAFCPFFTAYKSFSHFGFTLTSAETADDGTVWPCGEDGPEMHWAYLFISR